ncbi:apoptosis facilitator Bcl-2-like protein 14 [Cyprinodon tularosa]|uniref:apoptosis facilitator Bcl-2-like protein 14 n=1 Tax=Cyprinodon tularosa TaxID=77115 RepID=UPI0018E1F0E8|nr:apoptosis facilitator Bcl-2-like protein 14 [Cyprinodon tularosa]
MEDGQVENHVPKPANGMEVNTHMDSKLNSDVENIEDTVEFKLMRAYAQRRRPKKVDPHKENGKALTDYSNDADPTPGQTTEKTGKEEGKKKRKKKTIWRHLKPILKCVRPQTDEMETTPTPATPTSDETQDDPTLRCFPMAFTLDGDHDSSKDEDELGEVASRVIGLADELELTEPPSELEADCPEDALSKDDLEKTIGLLLRCKGDDLNKKFDELHIAADLFLNYNFFSKLLNAFFVRIGFRNSQSDALGPQAGNKTQVAATLEITSRLSSVEGLPRSRLFEHGARYLQEYYSSWAQQQGGYEAIFQDDEEVD